MDPYRILQVRPDAEDTVIAAAYRALARRYHPDVIGDRAVRSMTEINAAWEILRDPARRREYDRTAGGGTSSPQPAAARGQPQRANPHDRSRATSGPGFSAAPADSAGTHRNGIGAAGPPPGRPFGSVLTFGRHIGWSLGEIARVDPGYLEWLEDKPEGRPLLEEIDALLKRVGYRLPAGDARMSRKRWWRRS
jgi:curved DNA-binding protein CbpA